MLRADDVTNARFQATKFRDGYDQDEVDDFLDRVVDALRQHESREAVLVDALRRHAPDVDVQTLLPPAGGGLWHQGSGGQPLTPPAWGAAGPAAERTSVVDRPRTSRFTRFLRGE